MKKLNGKYKPPPPLSVIEAARAGEADAMEQVLLYSNQVGASRKLLAPTNQYHIYAFMGQKALCHAAFGSVFVLWQYHSLRYPQNGFEMRRNKEVEENEGSHLRPLFLR